MASGPRWWGVALLAPALLYALAAVGLRLVTGRWPDLAQYGRSREYAGLPLLAYWLANILCYGFGEEVGWRGFAPPRLQRGGSALAATVGLSLVWAAWHLPLFSFAGGLAQLGLAGAVGWYFSLLTGAVLLTWFHNSTGGSVPLVAIFHGTIDIAFTSPAGPELANAMGALITVWGLAVLLLAGPRHLACNAICPSATITNIAESMPQDRLDPTGAAHAGEFAALAPAYLPPDDIARLALFLASDESRHINGAIIPADGGWAAV